MENNDNKIFYLDDGVSFASTQAAGMREIYLPLCAQDDRGIKSSITPFLSGDIKIDISHYLTKPASRQDLRYPLRNFFIRTDDGGVFSLFDRDSVGRARVDIGQLWHKLTNRSDQLGVVLEAVNFVPVSGDNVELMMVTVRNISDQPMCLTAVGCIPVFGRPLVNKHDHEHVTSLLHRTHQIDQGMIVCPTMIFNEKGHRPADCCYFVFGAEADGRLPEGSFPTVETFLSESGTWQRPQAVVDGQPPEKYSAEMLDGKEVAGAVCFSPIQIDPGQTRGYVLMIGAAATERDALAVYARFNTVEKVEQALGDCQSFWMKKSSSITCQTADSGFDSWMRWVMLQPVLRRIFGCSFLPDHDYGKGGKGWRDLWQDLLSLILIEPDQVRSSLVENFNGVRVDGTNATIIGAHKGEFIADRNAITRVWMDHGAWPFLTVMLYLDQTGDDAILFEPAAYFRDMQMSRTTRKDEQWRVSDGNTLRTKAGSPYTGTILEHLLVQALVQFFNVGEHNMIRLESADWNDGLDMAFDRGESVAFSSFYAANLNGLADLLQYLRDQRSIEHLEVFTELTLLMNLDEKQRCDYDDIHQKQQRLFQNYFPAVESGLSGEKARVDIALLIKDLRQKADWMFQKIRSQEKITVTHHGQTYQWFNGYYDNQGQRVEGLRDQRVCMTLTGQVFSVMSGLADDVIQDVVESVNTFLKDPQFGAVRLNTDFGMRNYLDLGRAFSFAYGTKENGAVFSHMAVMYGYALYKRGLAREGFEVLTALYRMAADFTHSGIYPNLPEYFDGSGKGMYSYLTGSASWMVLTLLTQSFGIRGEKGNMVIEPKLVREQFSNDGRAVINSVFAGQDVSVRYENPLWLDFGEYAIGRLTINGREGRCEIGSGQKVTVIREEISQSQHPIEIVVDLVKQSC